MIIRLDNIQPESNCSRLVDLNTTALLLIDMQIDFLYPNGFGSSLGNDVTKLQHCIKPCQTMLQMARDVGMLVIHTREGHRPDMTDVHKHKLLQTNHVIGQDGRELSVQFVVFVLCFSVQNQFMLCLLLLLYYITILRFCLSVFFCNSFVSFFVSHFYSSKWSSINTW